MSVTLALCALLTAPQVAATPSSPVPQGPPQPDTRATAALGFLDGVWIGPASMTDRTGTTRRFEQMERVGPMLGGQIRVMEGKARDPSGKSLFNAFTVFSRADRGGIEMRSHTPGMVGSRTIQLTGNGFVWEHPAGARTMRYVIQVKNGVWRETGELVAAGAAPVRVFEMTLKRVGDTSWPADNPAFITR